VSASWSGKRQATTNSCGVWRLPASTPAQGKRNGAAAFDGVRRRGARSRRRRAAARARRRRPDAWLRRRRRQRRSSGRSPAAASRWSDPAAQDLSGDGLQDAGEVARRVAWVETGEAHTHRRGGLPMRRRRHCEGWSPCATTAPYPMVPCRVFSSRR
jgi:hypothetical protein